VFIVALSTWFLTVFSSASLATTMNDFVYFIVKVVLNDNVVQSVCMLPEADNVFLTTEQFSYDGSW